MNEQILLMGLQVSSCSKVTEQGKFFWDSLQVGVHEAVEKIEFKDISVWPKCRNMSNYFLLISAMIINRPSK